LDIFEFEPSYVWEAVNGHDVLITEFESGKEQRRYKNRLPREWNLSFKGRPEDIQQIEWFFHKRKGPYEVFSWQPPNEDGYIKARFKDEALSITSQGYLVSEVSLTIREVL